MLPWYLYFLRCLTGLCWEHGKGSMSYPSVLPWVSVLVSSSAAAACSTAGWVLPEWDSKTFCKIVLYLWYNMLHRTERTKIWPQVTLCSQGITDIFHLKTYYIIITRNLTQLSLWTPSNSKYFMILWHYAVLDETEPCVLRRKKKKKKWMFMGRRIPAFKHTLSSCPAFHPGPWWKITLLCHQIWELAAANHILLPAASLLSFQLITYGEGNIFPLFPSLPLNPFTNHVLVQPYSILLFS